MEYIGVGVIIVGSLAISCLLGVKALDQNSLFSPWAFGFLAWAVLMVAALAYASEQEEKKGPCLRYETSMHYNAATKTMMPARVCAERGEWVN